jgi:hypothetical protein
MRRRVAIGALVAGGLLVALLLALVVSPYASSSPDGLEKVAADNGFAERAEDHALADGPLAGYETKGVGSQKLSTGLAGVIGVAATFALAMVLILVLKAGRRRAEARAVPSAAVPSTGGP